MDFEKYTERVRGFIQSPHSLALREGHPQFTPEHLLKVLLDDPEGLCAGLIDRSAGSIAIDSELLERTDIRPGEKVHVWNVANGARFETYAIVGEPGEVCLNGAAARLVQRGDRVIVITYADYEDAELAEGFEPRVVHVDYVNAPHPELEIA